MSLYQNNRVLGRGQALESFQVALGATEGQPVLRIPGALNPGVVYFQVDDPGEDARAAADIVIFRERERTRGVQEFTIGSSGVPGAGVPTQFHNRPIIGGGSAVFSGGIEVQASRSVAAIPTTVSVWIDYTPGISSARDRDPFTLHTQIAGGATTQVGAVPAGARWIQILTDQPTANLVCTWLTAAGVVAADFNQWIQGAPIIAPAGLFLQIRNGGGVNQDVGIVYT